MREERRRRSWRPVVRALHRDFGYLLIGLTLVYALSGLAVNHISQWDPNFHSYRAVRELKTALPAEQDAAVELVRQRLGLKAAVKKVYYLPGERLDLTLEDRTVHVDPQTGRVVEEGQKPRFLLRVFNWLHLNRGKPAWRVVADAYAIGLLFLAISGMFMLSGKNGMWGRGTILVAIGVAIPVLYVVLSGGPGRH